MKIGDIVEVVSQDYDYEGNAVCKLDNYVIFVEGLLINERAKVKIYKKSKSYAFATVIDIIDKSEERINSDCSVYNKCGGCNFMHTDYENQLKIKRKIVSDAFSRSKLKDCKVHDVVGMEEPWSYRNKVSVPIRKISGEIKVGFYEKKSHNIVEFDNCNVQTKISNKIISTLAKVLKKCNFSCYDEHDNTGVLRHVVVRNSSRNEYMVILVVTKHIDMIDMLKEQILLEVPEVKTIIVNINSRKTNVILGTENMVIHGEGFINDYYEDKVFKISPNSFFQINHKQTLKLYNKAIELANIKDSTIIDAYCGVGTISIYASDRIKKAIGMDIAKSSIIDAKNNALINNLDNVRYLEGKAEELIKTIVEDEPKATVIVDPPRKGCDAKFLDAIIESDIESIVYISCNHNTLARDISYLSKNNYICRDVYLYDMFPQTKHVECVCIIERNK